MKIKKIFTSKKFRFGSLATLLTVGFIAIAVAVNIVASILVERLPLKVDLTAQKTYNISTETVELLSQIKEEVEITVLETEKALADGGQYTLQAKETFQQFKQSSPKIKLTYLDLNANPTFSRNYASDNLTQGDIIVKSSKRYRVLKFEELWGYEYDDYGQVSAVTSSQVELKLATAIAAAISDDLPTAVTITGHEEQAADGLLALLNRNNYELKTQNLTTESIDNNADFIIINAPKRDYTEAELKKLDAFLDNDGQLGKNLFITFDPGQPALPNLEKFVTDWGIEVGDGLVYETNADNTVGTGLIFSVTYGETDFTKELSENRVFTLAANARPLKLLFKEDSARETFELLKSAETAVLRPVDAAEDWTPGSKDKQGAYTLLAQGKRYRYLAGTTPITLESSVMVCGSNQMFSSAVTANSAFGNADLSVALFDQQFSGNKIDLDILPKEMGGRELSITEGQLSFIGLFVFTVLVPLLVLVAGIVIWLRRRHL